MSEPTPRVTPPLLAFDEVTDSSTAANEAFESIRARLAKSETPAVLIIIAMITMILSIITYELRQEPFPEFHLIDFASGFIILAVGLLLRRDFVGATATRWAFATCMVLLASSLLVQKWIDPQALVGYVLIVICMVGPLTLSWRPFLTAGSVMVAEVVVVSTRSPGDSAPDAALLAITALLASALLLMVRITSIRGQASAVAGANETATTDKLTGVLNRRGLEELFPTFAATARRLVLPVTVYFIDVDGLKAANDEHGHVFGDVVLQCVARAIRSTVREGDLVARWGGDEFVVVGFGTEADQVQFADRLCRTIRWSDIDLKHWCGTVSVGRASGPLHSGTIDQFVRHADADMYARRQVRRAQR